MSEIFKPHRFNFSLVLEKLLFVLILLLLIVVPLYPKLPLFNVTGTFVAIRLEDFLIAVTLGIWVIYMFVFSKWKLFFKDNLNKAVLLFFFVAILSVFSGIFLTHTIIDSKIGMLHFLRRVEFMMLLPVVFYTVKSKKQLSIILALISIVILLVNGYALGQKFLDWPVISTTNSEFSKGTLLKLTPGARVNSTFAGYYDLAVFLAMALVLNTTLFFAYGKKTKLWIITISIFSLVILVMTAARVSFAAVVGGVFLNIVLMRKKYLIIFFVVLLTAILIYPSQLRDRLISTITINVLHMGQRYESQTDDQRIRSSINIPTVSMKTSSTSALTSTFASPSGKRATDITPGEPIDTTQLGVYRSFAIRLNLEWPRAIIGLMKNPLLGTGFSSLVINIVSNRVDAIATDNDFLRSLGEVGLLGTISFGLVLIEISKRLWRQMKSQDKQVRSFTMGVFALIFAFLINATFIDVFEASKVATLFWMILGLALATERFKNETN